MTPTLETASQQALQPHAEHQSGWRTHAITQEPTFTWLSICVQERMTLNTRSVQQARKSNLLLIKCPSLGNYIKIRMTNKGTEMLKKLWVHKQLAIYNFPFFKVAPKTGLPNCNHFTYFTPFLLLLFGLVFSFSSNYLFYFGST